MVLPFALLGVAEPAAAVVSLGFIGGLAVVALADAVGARASLAGIGVEMAAVNRMSKDREAKMELRIRNERQKKRQLRLALPLPREIESPQEDMRIELPAASEWSRLEWRWGSGRPARIIRLPASTTPADK